LIEESSNSDLTLERGMIMRNVFAYKIVIIVASFFFYSNVYAQSGWELYDDFSAASIDTQKWSVDDSSATITIENGRAKFVHNAGNPIDISFLSILDSPETIAGVKATVNVDSCVGGDEVRIRITGFVGKLGNNFIFKSLELRPYQDRIVAGAHILSPPPNFDFVKEYFYGEFNDPVNMNIIGSTYTLSTTNSLRGANYVVVGQGELEYSFPDNLKPILPVEDNFSGIGTWSQSGVGTCTAYFDDVYIMRKSGFNWSFIIPVITKDAKK